MRSRHHLLHSEQLMPITCDMIGGRSTTSAGLGLLMTALVAAGLVGEALAGENAWLADSNPGSEPASRPAFDASADRPSGESRLAADPSALAEVKKVEELGRAADEGDAHAQLSLGLRYENGCGVRQDTAQALKWFRRAAERGLDQAQYVLGCCCNGEDGFPRDPAEPQNGGKKPLPRVMLTPNTVSV